MLNSHTERASHDEDPYSYKRRRTSYYHDASRQFFANRSERKLSRPLFRTATHFSLRLHNPFFEPAIFRLPNEILDKIAGFLAPTTIIHVLEGTSLVKVPRAHLFRPAWTRSPRQHKKELSNLRHLALVSRRLRAIAERALYRHVSLPQLPMSESIGVPQYPKSSVPLFARTLFNRPDLAAQVRGFRVWILDRRLVRFAEEAAFNKQNPYVDVFEKAWSHVSRMQLSFNEAIAWSRELHDFYELALHATIITLLPRLQSLEMFAPLTNRNIWQLRSAATERPGNSDLDCLYLDAALRHGSAALTSMRVEAPLTLRIPPLQTLTTLTLDILFFADRMDILHRPFTLPHVHTVNVMLNLAIIGLVKSSATFKVMHPRLGLALFLRDVVTNVRTFAIQSPSGVLPYFHRLDTHCEKMLTLHLDGPQDIEYNPLVIPKSDPHAWMWLFEALHPVKDKLVHFSLPDNWFASMGKRVRAIPSLQHLSCVQTLRLPKVALISNPFARGFVPGEATPAIGFLPRSLESLTVTQVDTETCAWLQGALENHGLFPAWKEMRLVFRDDYHAILPDEFIIMMRESRIHVAIYWMNQEWAFK